MCMLQPGNTPIDRIITQSTQKLIEVPPKLYDVGFRSVAKKRFYMNLDYRRSKLIVVMLYRARIWYQLLYIRFMLPALVIMKC